MLDVNKYNKKIFNKNLFINNKIKALFLLFDKYVWEYKLNYFEKQRLINVWIAKFVAHEEYEVAEAFKQRKIVMWRKWRKIHRLASAKLFWRVWRRRLNKILG
jgi:hypothetical protein